MSEAEKLSLTDEQPPALAQLHKRLARLEDLRAIEDLKFRYTASLDFGYDLDALVECFTEDGRWYSEAFGGDLHGRSEIREYFKKLARDTPQVLHYATSPRIDVNEVGDRATAEFYLLCLATVRRKSSDQEAVVILGTYQDICVKTDGVWQFEEIRANVRERAEWSRGWAI